jgi:hypothetical protein
MISGFMFYWGDYDKIPKTEPKADKPKKDEPKPRGPK